MNFGLALEQLKLNKKVAREGWNGKGMWICLSDVSPIFELDGKSYGRNNYIFMKTANNYLVPWTASQTDVLAEDWIVL